MLLAFPLAGRVVSVRLVPSIVVTVIRSESTIAAGSFCPGEVSSRPGTIRSDLQEVPPSSDTNRTTEDLIPSRPEYVTGKRACLSLSHKGRPYVGKSAGKAWRGAVSDNCRQVLEPS